MTPEKFPRRRIVKTIVRGCRRIVDCEQWPTRRQVVLMHRYPGLTEAVMHELLPENYLFLGDWTPPPALARLYKRLANASQPRVEHRSRI